MKGRNKQTLSITLRTDAHTAPNRALRPDARHERMVQININNRVRQWASGGEPAERFPTLTG